MPPAAKRDVMELARERLAVALGEAGAAEMGDATKLDGVGVGVDVCAVVGGGESNVLARSIGGAAVAARRANELVEGEPESVVLDADGWYLNVGAAELLRRCVMRRGVWLALVTDVMDGEGEADRIDGGGGAASNDGWASTGGVQVGPPVDASDDWKDETDSDEAMTADDGGGLPSSAPLLAGSAGDDGIRGSTLGDAGSRSSVAAAAVFSRSCQKPRVMSTLLAPDV